MLPLDPDPGSILVSPCVELAGNYAILCNIMQYSQGLAKAGSAIITEIPTSLTEAMTYDDKNAG